MSGGKVKRPRSSGPRALADARRERQLAWAVAAHQRAIAHRAAGRFAASEAACRRALVEYRASEGERHPDVANVLVELGAALEARDRPAEAMRCHRRALAILEDSPRGDEDVARLEILAEMALAGLERGQGRLEAANVGQRRALALIRRRLPKGDRLLAHALNNLGVLRKAQGRYSEAVAYYARAARVVSRDDREMRATLAHNLGGIEFSRSRLAAAEPPARRAVRLRTALHGRHHPAVAADCAALAAILEGRGKVSEAARLYRFSLPVYRRALGPGSVEGGLTLAGLASVESQRRRFDRARSLYARALPILERRLGRDHPDVALTLNNMAILERQRGALRRAETLLRRALRRLERSLGAEHPHTRSARRNLLSLVTPVAR